MDLVTSRQMTATENLQPQGLPAHSIDIRKRDEVIIGNVFPVRAGLNKFRAHLVLDIGVLRK